MQARDIMTPNPVSVTPDTPVSTIAQRLVERGVSALPVVDAHMDVIGMVSEGDLIRGCALLSNETDAQGARRDWWLALLAEGEPLAAAFLASLPAGRTAGQIMTSPVITVTGGADLSEVARLLSDYHIKRVPVVENHRLTGIVSRADLVRAFVQMNPAKPHVSGGFDGLLAQATASLGKYLPHESEAAPGALTPAGPQSAGRAPDAGAFRTLMSDFAQQKVLDRLEARRLLIETRKTKVKELIDTHLSDRQWSAMMHAAADAAGQGLKEHLLLRFPGDVCSDGGRAINQGEDDWPATLKGEPAEIYLRWKAELEPRGFRLKARTLEYIDGFPGDAGLFLNWAAEART